MTHPDDCPHCKMPAPIAGVMIHARDCPLSGERRTFRDWFATRSAEDKTQLGKLRVDPITFVPLVPLRDLKPEQKAALLEAARMVEAGWAAGANTKTRGAGGA